MPAIAFFQISKIDWYDDPQETLQAQVFILVCAVLFVVLGLASMAGFLLDGLSWRRLPALALLGAITICILLSYQQRSTQWSVPLFLIAMMIAATVYTDLTDGLNGYGAAFSLLCPFVAQLFSTRKVSFGVYLLVLGHFWYLFHEHGADDQLLLLRTIFHSLTLTGLLGVSMAFAVMSERARSLLDKERRKAEAENETKSAFLANTSHEVRTPLNGILGMAQILQQEPLAPEQKERVAIILDSGQALLTVLNDLLDLSKIEAGRLELAPAPEALGPVIENAIRLWEGKASEKGLTLELELGVGADALLSFDAVRVRQCLTNLLSNAVKFTQQGGVRVVVTMEARERDQVLVTVSVSDSGIGLTEDTKARLFKPFSQADKGISAQYGGTGLGLNISRQLARMMGGDISVDSTAGQGSIFTLTFRADGVDALQAEQSTGRGVEASTVAASTAACRDIKVLLVDDNPINRKVARAFLTTVTDRIEEATNGAEALDCLRVSDEPFDLLLLDMNMPIMDGPEAITRIRNEDAAWSDIPAIALTADAMSGDRERYLAMGLNGYISKPVDLEHLLLEINSVLVERGSA